MVRQARLSPLSALMRRLDAVADGETPADAFPTGFPSVDRVLGGGIRAGDLVVLGGDVGSGKSALSLAMALRSAQEERPTLFVTTEMTTDRVMERMLAIEGRAKMEDIRQGAVDDAIRASVGAAAMRLRDRVPVIVQMSRDPMTTLTALLSESSEPRLVVLDSMQGLAGTEKPLPDEESGVVRSLKRLAVDNNVAFLVTAQLSASVESRADPRPRLDDFGALGSVKHHADVVLGLFREEMYRKDPGVDGATELFVLKNRDGITGYVDLYFYKQWLRFEDMLDPDR
jgi:replicative DNA helicase